MVRYGAKCRQCGRYYMEEGSTNVLGTFLKDASDREVLSRPKPEKSQGLCEKCRKSGRRW